MPEPTKLSIHFKCRRCGLMTPGAFETPELTDDNLQRPVTLRNRCDHCNHALVKKFPTLKKLIHVAAGADVELSDEELKALEKS
jgi:hypothetical protein